MRVRSLLAALSWLVAVSARAQAPAAGKSDVWGRSPVSAAGDDRFSNPKKPLYAGPDGWWNTGEVRAAVSNDAKTAYTYKANFQLNSGVAVYHAVKGEQVLSFDFGSTARPKPGVYKVGVNGSLAQKTVHMAFADVSNNKLLEWSAADGAGTLTVKLVNGFTYFTCRRLTFQPTGLSNKGELAKPRTIGFEGALSPE